MLRDADAALICADNQVGARWNWGMRMRSPDISTAEPVPLEGSAASASRGLSLRLRLVLLVLADVIPLLLFILGYQYVEYLRDVHTTGQRTLELARSMSLLVDAELQVRIAALQALAVSRAVESGDFQTFRERAAEVIAHQFPGANIVLLRQDGQQVMNTLLPPGEPLPVRQNMESTRTVFTTGRPAVSNLYPGAVGQRLVAAIDVPVEDRNGKVAYVLSMNPELDTFADVILRQRLPSTWLSGVYDGNGIIIVRVPHGAEYVGQAASATTVRHLITEREGIHDSTSLEGIPTLVVFSRTERFGWEVAIGVPRAELTGAAWMRAMRTLEAGSVLLALSLVLALYAARRIAGPIGSLRRLAAATDHDTPLHLAPTGLRDIDEVAQALTSADEGRRRSRDAEAVLRDGIDAIPEGFVIYDDDDRLVMCNESYRRLFSGIAEHLVPGARLADLWRAVLSRGSYPAAHGREEDWIAERIREHRALGDGVEQQVEGGQWILIRNRRLSNGRVAGLRIDITARKMAEQAVGKSEERFRLVVEAVPAAIVAFDAAGVIELVNVQAERMFGYDRAELLGRPVELLLAESSRTDHPEERNAFFADPRARSIGAGRKLFCRRRDGAEFPVDIGMSPMEAADGMKALVSIVDTTVRREADRIQSYYAAIVESSADAIIAKDLNTLVTSWNKSAELMFGWSASEIVGKPITRIIPPDRLDEEGVILAQVHAGHGIDHFETFRLHKDGTAFPVSLTISPIRGPDGNIIGASKIVRDISERTRMGEHLRASEDRFRSIFSAVGEGVFIVSAADGTFTEINEAGCVMFGYAVDELIGSDLVALSSGDAPYTRRDAAERIEQATSGNPQRFSWHCRAKDGHLFWAEISVRSALIGGHQALLAIVLDTTGRLAIEAQLRQAQKMEAIGNLSGGMAHDFNNMLGVIIGSLDLAGPLVSDHHDVSELVEEALNAALSGAALTQRLLAFARKQSLRPERIAPNKLIYGIVQLLRRTLGENIEIVLDLADDLWPAIADSAQLEASLTNLATNARDAMPNGGRLSISTFNQSLDADYAAANVEAKAGDFVSITVSDSGTGMTQAIVQHIFEPFYTTKEPGKGTGLGLSMVFGFIKQSGGHIDVYSELGVGTTFRLYLPRAATASVEAATQPPTPLPRGAGESILVVEDNPQLRQVVMRQLTGLGYKPIEADGPAAAIAILERGGIDLLFTDVVMPGPLNGIGLVRQVIERWPAVRVALTSGFAGSRFDDLVDARGAAVQLLSKPYRVESLAQVLRQVLDC
jgi:PAS domain S-box-containing protein